MRKTLIMIVIILLLVTIGFLMFNSISIGGLQILGVKGLGDSNQKLESSIRTLTRLSSTGYEEALKDVNNSTKQYNTTKQEYDEYLAISTNNQTTTQLQKYEIEFLWTKIGAHASKENVVLRLEVEANSTSTVTGYYDLKFTVTGDYVGLTDFIYDIENDSSLGFKIEKFKMTPQGSSLQATFTCTNIAINIDSSLLTKKDNKENSGDQENSNTTNTNSNTTNTNTTNSNTTNSTKNTSTVNSNTTNTTNSTR